jgi:xylose isomerase
MSTGFFADIKPVRYDEPGPPNRLTYRFNDKDEVVAGKRLEDHLRFAVAYWPASPSSANWRWPTRKECA